MMSRTATTITQDSRLSSLPPSATWSLSSKNNVWDNSIRTNVTSLNPGVVELKNGNNSATDSEVDAYAQKILEECASSASQSQDDAIVVDECLGAYITNRIREWKGQLSSSIARDITTMPDYLSLCELLQEYCSITSSSMAKQSLETIAQAVLEKRIPPTTSPSTAAIQSLTESLSQHGLQINVNTTSSIFHSSIEKDSTSHRIGEHSIDELEFKHQRLVKESMVSPLAADDLIPLDLLEDPLESEQVLRLDDMQQQKLQPHLTQTFVSTEPLNHDETAFPPLSAVPPSTANSSSSSLGRSLPKPKSTKLASVKGEKSGAGKSNKGYKADDLAAALFRHHPRSRQSSIDETSNATNSSTSGASPSFQALHMNVSTSPMSTFVSQTVTEIDEKLQNQQFLHGHDNHQFTGVDDDPEHLMTLIHHCSEVLLSMNPELSMGASFAAAATCQGNIAAAQYVINKAATAPPICRHLLNAGCYRSDCQFSHSIDSHTCIFWLKGRCSRQFDNTSGNISACRFLHGFHPSLIRDLPQEYLTSPSKVDDGYNNSAYTVQYNDEHFGNYYGTGYDYSSETGSAQNDYNDFETSVWRPSNQFTSHAPSLFSNIASQGYSQNQSFSNAEQYPSTSSTYDNLVDVRSLPTVKIPLDLWNAHNNRDASAFHITDPLERYYYVQRTSNRDDVIDLHFQSLQTFPVVLDTLLVDEIVRSKAASGLWIVTGTGHHVGALTHQKNGATLENAVLLYLAEHYGHEYSISRGCDRNGHGGAIMIVAKGRF